MQSTPSLPLFPGSLKSGKLTPDRVISMGQIELFDIETVGQKMGIIGNGYG